MAYVKPNITFSSIVIDGDIIFSLYAAINYALRDLGLDHHESYKERSLIYETDDKDVDKFVNLNLEIEANELLDELSARMYITEFYDFRPSLVKLSGSIRIDGFEVVN